MDSYLSWTRTWLEIIEEDKIGSPNIKVLLASKVLPQDCRHLKQTIKNAEKMARKNGRITKSKTSL